MTDWRSVSEVLQEAEQLTRDILQDSGTLDGRALFRSWGEAVDAASDVWQALPQSHRDREPNAVLMDRVQSMVTRSHRNLSAKMHGPETDERMLRVSEQFARAAELIERYGPWEQRSLTPAQLMDAQAARVRMMHTLYLATHAVQVGLRDTAAEQRRIAQDQRLSHRAQQSALGQAGRAEAALARVEAVESVLGGYAHRWYPRGLGSEHRPEVLVDRLGQALAAWDVHTNRLISGEGTPADLAMVAKGRMWVTGATHSLWQAASETGHIDHDQYRTRLTPGLTHLFEQWRRYSQTWETLAQGEHRPATPSRQAYLDAFNEVRASLREVMQDSGVLATPAVVAERTDLSLVIQELQQSLASGIDLTHALQDAAQAPSLRVSARGVHTLLTEEDREDLRAEVSPAALLANKTTAPPPRLRGRLTEEGWSLAAAAAAASSSATAIESRPTVAGPEQRADTHTASLDALRAAITAATPRRSPYPQRHHEIQQPPQPPPQQSR